LKICEYQTGYPAFTPNIRTATRGASTWGVQATSLSSNQQPVTSKRWFGDFKVLSEINETVEGGQTMVICGPSGSGKSTLLRCVNGLEPYQEGEIIVDGVSLSDPKTNLYKLRELSAWYFNDLNFIRT
jgi:ABC-type methionine transport system ATPase subunit